MGSTLQQMEAFSDGNKKIKGILAGKKPTDDKLFAVCMQDEEFCKLVLSIILEIEVLEVEFSEIQKSIKNLPGYKSIRLDVYAKTKNGIYNVEIQKINNDSMPKRARFYQGLLDVANLYEEKNVKYEDLAKTIVVFITDFDVFGKDYYRYRFRNLCLEDRNLELGDETEKIFLNLAGHVRNDTSLSLVKFLNYLKSGNMLAEGNSKLEYLDHYFKNLILTKKAEDNYMRLVGNILNHKVQVKDVQENAKKTGNLFSWNEAIQRLTGETNE